MLVDGRMSDGEDSQVARTGSERKLNVALKEIEGDCFQFGCNNVQILEKVCMVLKVV